MSLKEVSPIATSLIIINVMLGTGPIIVPPVFLLAGIGLATIWTSVTVFFSYIASEFIVEAASICNAFTYHEDQFDKVSNVSVLSKSQYSMHSVDQDNTQIEQIVSDENLDNDLTQKLDQQLSQKHFQRFHLREIFELGQMGEIILNRKVKIAITIMVVTYLFGVIISKCIITGKIISKVFVGIYLLDSYYFWLILFFVSSAALSFKDVSSIKLLQIVIAGIRFSVIFLLLAGPIYLIAKDGAFPLTNFSGNYINSKKETVSFEFVPFDFKFFDILFSNLTFAYMMQHSLPNMITYCKPQIQIKKVLILVFSFSFLVILMISLIGILAFGPTMADPEDINNLQYFNINFKGKIDWIYYYCSFYMFLNIAALPVLTIVLRNNLMKLITPKLFPNKSFEITKWTLLYTAAILAFVFGCALTMRNYIQYVLNITGGLFGVLILITIPSIFVIKGREKCIQKYGENYHNPHEAIIHYKYLPYVTLVISIGLFIYNFYLNIMHFVNGGGGH